MKNIAPWLLAYISLIGLSRMQADILSNSVFAILVWVATALFFRSIFPILNKRLAIISAATGIIFSACMIFGGNIFFKDSMRIEHLSTWLDILAGAIFFTAIISCLINFFPQANKFFTIKTLSRFDEKISGRKYFFMSWALIFIAWLPALFATWPGIFAYDSLPQVSFYDAGKIVIYHPPLHTLLIGFCTATLGKFFGSHELGLLIYSLIQMLCVSGVFAAISCFMFRRKLSGGLRLGWQIYFMFFPLNPIMALSATKDILYAAFFALFVLLMFIEFDSAEQNSRLIILMIVTGFLGITFRSQGIYVFILGAATSFILLKNQRLKFGKIIAAVLILFGIYNGIVHGILKPENSRLYFIHESLGVPVVQLSRVGVYRRGELTREELQEIEKYIPDYKAYEDKTSQGSSDSVRGSFKGELVQENPEKFFALWLKFAKKYPTDYIDAFGRLTVGEWYPDLNFENYYTGQPYFQYHSFKISSDGKNVLFIDVPNTERIVGIISPDEKPPIIVQNRPLAGFAWLNKFYVKLAYHYTYEKVPVISMLFSTGFIFWLILIYVAWCIYRRKYALLAPVSFPLMLWLSMVMGPVELYRYTFPLAVTIPILFTRILTEDK